MKIYLIRHGETGWNKYNLLQGRQDIKLNDSGIIKLINVDKYYGMKI